MDFVAFCSYGNDSVALLQLLHEYRLPQQRRVGVVYSETGWAAPGWGERVARGEEWATSLGFEVYRTASEGFPALVRRKKMFPRGQAQFCTEELKIKPAQRWLAEHDPAGHAVCAVGVRRAESERRKNTPAFVPISDAHGGRSLWHPLVEFSDEDRDALIWRTPFEVLPHRSDECNPCIFSGRKDLRRVELDRWSDIAELERDIGPGRTMFRAKAYAGAQGASEMYKWAHSERGKYRAPQYEAPENDKFEDDEPDCDSGFCGS